MDETINVTNEASENQLDATPVDEDAIKDAIEEQLNKFYSRGMLIGAQTFCHIVLKKIVDMESKPSKTSMNDYKRLVKDIKNFCTTGVSRKVDENGETHPIEEEPAVEETVQN